MIHLVDKEQQHGQDNHDEEAHGAGQEVHDLAHLRQREQVLTNDVAIADDVRIGHVVVIALGGKAAHAVNLVDGGDAVRVERVLVVDDGMERHDVAHLELGGVALFDEDEVALVKRGRHGVGLHGKRGEAGDVRDTAVLARGERGKRIQGRHQDDDPHDDAQRDGCDFFNRLHDVPYYRVCLGRARPGSRRAYLLFLDALEAHRNRIVSSL